MDFATDREFKEFTYQIINEKNIFSKQEFLLLLDFFHMKNKKTSLEKFKDEILTTNKKDYKVVVADGVEYICNNRVLLFYPAKKKSGLYDNKGIFLSDIESDDFYEDKLKDFQNLINKCENYQNKILFKKEKIDFKKYSTELNDKYNISNNFLKYLFDINEQVKNYDKSIHIFYENEMIIKFVVNDIIAIIALLGK